MARDCKQEVARYSTILMGKGNMDPYRLQELEAWLVTLEPARFPTESEIELWDLMYEIDLFDAQSHSQNGMPPEGGDVLSIFADSSSWYGETFVGVKEK